MKTAQPQQMVDNSEKRLTAVADHSTSGTCQDNQSVQPSTGVSRAASEIRATADGKKPRPITGRPEDHGDLRDAKVESCKWKGTQQTDDKQQTI